MAFLKVENVAIKGLAAAVPKEKKDISKLECFAPGEAEKVMALTGVTESRLAPEGMVCSDYCQAAAEKLIEEIGWEKESIDILVFVSVSSPAISILTESALIMDVAVSWILTSVAPLSSALSPAATSAPPP